MRFTGMISNHETNDGRKYQRFNVELNTFEIETILTLIHMFDTPKSAEFYKEGFELQGHMKGLRKDFLNLQKQLKTLGKEKIILSNPKPRKENSREDKKDIVRGMLKALKVVEKPRPMILTRKENRPLGPDPYGERTKKIRNRLRQEIIDDINREINLINNKSAK